MRLSLTLSITLSITLLGAACGDKGGIKGGTPPSDMPSNGGVIKRDGSAPNWDAPGTSTTPDGGAAGPAEPNTDPAPCANLRRPQDPYTLVDPFPMLPEFDGPTNAVQAPGQPTFWYVTERLGRIRRFANRADVNMATTSLDISPRVDISGDTGLLSIAFHPNFITNGEVYIGYTLKGNDAAKIPNKSRISRFRSTNMGATFDPASEEILIEIDQPFADKVHQHAEMRFGPDGYLWIGFGDGGDVEDGRGAAASLADINGKILRIDVNHQGPAGLKYSIPADNPYATMPGARGEIWARGFRNPWRFRFDPTEPGVIWVGDVGINRREEVNRVVKGGFYGWNQWEGTRCHQPPELNGTKLPCETTATLPHIEYQHVEGQSVTVGPVYKGKALPALANRLIFGDFISGHVWAMAADKSKNAEAILATRLAVVSFADASDNELYIVDFNGGRLSKIVPMPPSPEPVLPTMLSQTGCMEIGGNLPPNVIPYEINSQLYSDGATKRRWMALPPGGQIKIKADGDFEFPEGATLVKEFSMNGVKVETRLFVHHLDGEWAGYSYGWNAQGTEATLLGIHSGEMKKTVGATTWSHPSRYQCMACHTQIAGFTLGPEAIQLNRNYKYADGEENQLTHLMKLGVLAGPPPNLPALPDPFGTAPLAQRARSYLHSNCSGCHRPREDIPMWLDLRFTTPLPQTHACQDGWYSGFGPTIVKRLEPGKPEISMLSAFMHTLDELRMPLVGRSKVDPQGTALIDQWIKSLAGCN
jgi:uncharacterized repeat protein (TIGR03806 family)